MTQEKHILKRFSTTWAIEDPVDGLFHLMENMTRYTTRFKMIIWSGLLLGLLFFSYVIITVLYMIFTIGATFFFSQSQGTFLLIENLVELNFPVLSLPFTTIVILFLLQSMKFYEVLGNRVSTIQRIWDEHPQNQHMDGGSSEQSMNPMQISIILLDEIEEQIGQVKKHLTVSMVSLLISAIIISFLTFHVLLFDFSSIQLFHVGFTGIIPLFFLGLACFYVPFVRELHLFLCWQRQTFGIIKSIYLTTPPVTSSQSKECMSRLIDYLDKDAILNQKEKIRMTIPFQQNGINFDGGVISKNRMVCIRTAKQQIPQIKDIQDFIRDVRILIGEMKTKPSYIRAILLCDWREEEGDIPEAVEHYIMTHPIPLGKGVGGGVDVTYLQIIIDYGSIYTMYPLVPEQHVD